MYSVKRIQPALYRMSALPWAWVKLQELAEILGISEREVWIRHGHLSILKGAMNIAWEDDQEDGDGDENYSYMYEEDLADLDDNLLKTAFVPAGWALAVLKEAKIN